MEQEKPTKTREEIIAWYEDQLELARLRTELTELNSRAIVAEAQMLEAQMFLANANHQMKQAQEKAAEGKGGGTSSDEKPNLEGLKVVE